ncbi:MAG: glycosyltransferase family 4 protein [Syntrophobacteraceae bacterium]
MRILLLSQWFQPEPFFKGLPFARALRDRGHKVEVLTGFPNYPGGKVYSGYRIRPWQSEEMDGIHVIRTALYPSHDRSGFGRALNYLSFSLTSALFGAFLVDEPEVVYASNLPTLWPASLVLRLRYRCPVVYDILDLWPDSVAGSGMMNNKLLLKVLGSLCLAVYRRASHLVTTSPGIKAELVRRGVPEENITLIYNWCDEEYMKPAERDNSLAAKLGLSDDFIVMFAGTMGVMQGLDSILDAAAQLCTVQPKIRFVFVGGGIDRDRLQRLALERRLANVTFVERQPPETMAAILALADVLLVHLRDTPLFRMTIPSKIQAYMAVGKPILLGVQGDSADIIRNSGAGIIAEPERAESIARGVLQFFEMTEVNRERIGMNGREFYRDDLSINAGVRRFEAIFENACNGFRTSMEQ